MTKRKDAALGQIITFYSYKGGVGRSMSLANVACILEKEIGRKEKILMIDWDLEAPGLHEFFSGNRVPTKKTGPRRSNKLGLIELFYEITEKLKGSNYKFEIPDSFFDSINLQKYVKRVSADSPLHLMRAGNVEDPDYYDKVNRFEWVGLFDDFPRLITQFANYLRRKFKFVLVDSRTGYTDISGICTSLMPEKLVLVFTPNKQNIQGTVEMIYRATEYRKQSEDLRPLIIFPLASRIENAENRLQNAWRFGDSRRKIKGYQGQIEKAFREVYGLRKCDLTDYFDEVQLQHVPRYAYGEEIAILTERPSNRLALSRSYESFTANLLNDEFPWQSGSLDKISRHKIYKSYDLFLSYSVEDIEQAMDLYQFLSRLDVTTYLPVNDLRPGEDFEFEISQAIRSSKALLVLITPNSVKNEWIKLEYAHAWARKIPILTILHNISPEDLPDPLRNYQTVNFRQRVKIKKEVMKFKKLRLGR